MSKFPFFFAPKIIKTTCDNCGHWKSRHVKGGGCVVCAFLKSQGKIQHVCMEYFPSPLSQSEIDQARAASKDSYPPMTVCASCREIWMAHTGYLCPNGQTLFIVDLDTGSLV